MPPHQRWTQTAITELRTRLQAGESVSNIADALQRRPADILSMMGRLRLREA